MYSGASVLTYFGGNNKQKQQRHRLRADATDELDYDISYPGADGRTVSEFFKFSYELVYTFLTVVTQAESTSQLSVCNTSLLDGATRVGYVEMIYTDFQKWKVREKDANNIKPIIFAHVELLELLYPTSSSCSELNAELYTYFDSYSATILNGSFESQNLISMNFFKNLGTILSNVVQLDTCFEAWDGTCAGDKLGKTTFSLIDPSIVDSWNALANDVLI